MCKQSFLATVTLAFCLYLTGCKEGKDAVVNSMIKYGAYDDMYLGSSDQISPQWQHYKSLSEVCSENELAELCGHENPIVRCYAFKALTEICSPKTYGILLLHLSDTAEFNRSYGCFRVTERVMDNFLDQVGYDKKSLTKFNLTEDQYNHIDSILLFRNEIKQRPSSVDLTSRSYMLQRTKPLPHFYERVREIVTDGVYEALPLLAKYRNPNDTTIFKKLLLDDGLGARGRVLKNRVRNSIKYFPHPSFYPILKEQLLSEIGKNLISDDFESFPLYIALVQYPTKNTRKLFETALKKSGGEYYMRSSFIYEAVKSYPSQVFNGVVEGTHSADN